MKRFQFIKLAALALAATSVTHAYPILKLTDVGKSMTDDNGSIVTEGLVVTTEADSDGTGSEGWEGLLGGWTLNSDSGESGADLASSGIALDLSFQNYASGPSAFGPSNTMVITWTELFDASYAGPVTAHIDGTLAEGTTATFSVLEDDTQISPTFSFVADPGTDGSFSGDISAALFKNSGVTTLTEMVTLTATMAGQSSGDASVQAPPAAPDSALTVVLMVLGTGFLAFFSIARRRKA